MSGFMFLLIKVMYKDPIISLVVWFTVTTSSVSNVNKCNLFR